MQTDFKKLLLFVISYVIITLIIAYGWNVVLFRDLYEALGANTRADPIVWMGIIVMVIQSIVIAYVYPYFYRSGSHPVAQAVTFNLLMGTMAYSVIGFGIAAKFQIDPILPYLMYTLMFQVFQFVFTGIALGLIYGRLENNS
ncbi:hypothetical protein OO007_06965 [Cocleimonas sp. KMM 6892]|uniref:hypothetical protein n=1 Tax=unclassified Cocleimonas TaxID=2639732 RepID=UPI002DBA8513|nr:MULTISPECIES: hypothetical protein [unclassified Cocleimonas]MEB8431962.1 hypothetical protein [Cocleimonas sp. KMM 6892]MEC4714952.1 hypothetical protein [Cocleimonas sp. KMM 6895]MEC4744234.1 hypothetical protein [Cocleimonas sp. KMM 6896]